ncbi:MAG: hypothetical protein FWF11_00455 [Coriobacteriia bacterium]|nr:hypothetical protein [Coriobacteriia bacterium]
MKRTFIVFALAVALVLSFSALAGADDNVWKGFSPLNPAGGTPGFVSWDSALATMAQNSVPATMQATAHGGYVTTTTKCAACHSLHRATGIPQGTPAPNNQYFLTAGGDSCTVCHTAWGSMSTSKLVEWAVNGVNAGPHDTVNSCYACHAGGIHGGNGSDFHVMNVFMLGNVADDQIQAEFNSGGQRRGSGALWTPANPNSAIFESPAVSNTGAGWWANGTTSPIGMGSRPGEISPTTAGTVNSPQFAAARSVATGATCGQAGCHVYSAFANNVWGTGFERMDPSNPASTTVVTGHAVPAIGITSGTNNGGCGPCHPGNTAGLPTATREPQWRQFGCNQCHDMVGVATNSIAFPHGNRNIQVFEWDAAGAQVTTDIGAGNLWMYTGNIARALNAAGTGPAGASSAVGNITGFADPEWRVLTGVTSGALVPGTTGMNDGACLKCHIALDDLSLANTGSRGAWPDAATRGHAFGGTGGSAGNLLPGGSGSLGPNQAGGSSRIFLYR